MSIIMYQQLSFIYDFDIFCLVMNLSSPYLYMIHS